MADQKTMAQADATVGRDVPVSRDTDTPVTPGDYHNYEGSSSKQYDTYSSRMGKLEAALGNKESVKG
jgi:hypothetical protein